MEEITFTHVTCVYDDYSLVSSVQDDLAEDKVEHAIVFIYDVDDWSQLDYDVSICGSWRIADPDPLIVSVGVDGRIFTWGEDAGSETVDVSEEGPSHLMTLRCGAVIDGELYVAGMLRQVYVRKPGGNWTRIDEDMRIDAEKVEEGRGFLAIVGPAADNILAAGYAGDVWHFDGRSWSGLDSPTNVALSSIAFDEQGQFCVVGQIGTILTGTANMLGIVKQDVTEDDFWGVSFFKGHFYVASSFAVYRLEGDTLVDLSIPSEDGGSFGYLSTNGQIMWSVGEKDIFETQDGETWSAVSKP